MRKTVLALLAAPTLGFNPQQNIIRPVQHIPVSCTPARVAADAHMDLSRKDTCTSSWLEDVAANLRSDEAFFRPCDQEPENPGVSIDDWYVPRPEVNTEVEEVHEGRAVQARRSLRLGAGRTWIWEPQGEEDPGIAWESIGLVRDVKVFPKAADTSDIDDREIRSSHARHAHMTHSDPIAAGRRRHRQHRRKPVTAVFRLM
mmetsp:Transcript_18158/g.44856  ORF Transcript_18158/g.44856 Transcript_18158/m.44856 type:complete len:201 (-) Transcript_18158:172-774(-)